jgi:hypothetical protein
MVEIQDISFKQIQRKLKRKRIEQLAKEVFGKSMDVSESIDDLVVREKMKLRHYMLFNVPKAILIISPHGDEFSLYNEKYLDKTKELADRYENSLGGEVVIKANYFYKR